ncbi:TRAP transporter small permease subunit [Alloyangia pacifica]|uniref:TRAP transporter small permease protein n=1 Tax=Alloyangia pacifica TaxID=311180 RepID=A0A1I6TLS1_9RHOB|nr:TRAP transporter small permease [Alloyangia pacifica]SDH13871.1 TRAP-type mannitol/chloroaromatic compound transport system, small permease component [Alloyangia pacifica]SFS90202.1 TRAP-type mannitol/chloroaromatic compound transport system, small permease component [Alloyangia pacifica]
MKRFLARYADAMDRISVFIGHGCSVLFFACIVASALEVVMRYGFDRPTLWSTELAMTLCASAWVLSVGYVTQRHRHISITMVELLVSPRVWRLFRLFQMLIAFGAVAVLTAALWKPAVKVLSRTEYSGTAMNSVQPTYLKVLIVVGCAFYLLQLLANIIRWAQHTEGDVSGGH